MGGLSETAIKDGEKTTHKNQAPPLRFYGFALRSLEIAID